MIVSAASTSLSLSWPSSLAPTSGSSETRCLGGLCTVELGLHWLPDEFQPPFSGWCGDLLPSGGLRQFPRGPEFFRRFAAQGSVTERIWRLYTACGNVWKCKAQLTSIVSCSLSISNVYFAIAASVAGELMGIIRGGGEEEKRKD